MIIVLILLSTLYASYASYASIPQYVVNLDDKPFDRWKHITPIYSNNIKDVITTAQNELPMIFSKTITYFSKNYFINIPEHIGDYGEEIKGISYYSNISLDDIVLYNIFYEIFSLCTSVVVPVGDTIIHARNLDFGVMMESIVPILKNITIYVDFVKNNKTIYRAHTFAGLIGIFTGMKPYHYSITVNQRFALDGGFMGIYRWFQTKTPKWNSLLVRDLLENNHTYNDVIYILSNVELVAPIYYIVGGIHKYEGVLITRERNLSLYPIYLNSTNYIFQTNHDHWTNPLYIDDRTTSSIKYMNEFSFKFTLKNIKQLLFNKPTLNELTIYSSIMIPSINYMKGSIMTCLNKCHSIKIANYLPHKSLLQ